MFFFLNCSSSCPSEQNCTSLYGDGTCHPKCNTPVCGFDGGDCLPAFDPAHPQVDNIRTGYIGLVLNTNKTNYFTMERTILAHVGDVLRAVVRPAVDVKTQQPVVIDIDGGMRIRVSGLPDCLYKRLLTEI